MRTTATCPECGRVFDLLDEDDAGEFYYGHDCDREATLELAAERRAERVGD